MKSFHQLVFADGPTPSDPSDARQVGWYECWIGQELQRNEEAFCKYIPLVALPEVIAFVRCAGRDCRFRHYNECHALLFVDAARA